MRILIFMPYAFSISLFVCLIFFVDFSSSPMGIFAAFFVLLVLSLVLLDFVYVKSGDKKSPVINVDDISKKEQKDGDFNRKQGIKQKVNKTLNAIFFTGRYDIALDIIDSPLYATTSVKTQDKSKPENKKQLNQAENTLVAQLKFFILKRIKHERKLIKNAHKLDPDLNKGLRYLKHGHYSSAQKYFKANINHYTRYFYNKSLTLLQRQGQLNIEEQYQNLRRKRQLMQLGKRVEQKYKDHPRTVYEFYYDMQKVYGELGHTNALSKYSRLISVDEITQRELEVIKNRNKMNNLVYISDLEVIDKQTGKKITFKRAFIFIKKAFYLEGSATVYFTGVTIFPTVKKTYEIGVMRVTGPKGIFKNFTGGQGSVIHNGIITFSVNPMNIIKFQNIYPSGKKLSTFTLLGVKKDSIIYRLFGIVLKERLNYYAGVILSFIFVFLIAYFTRVGDKVKVNKALWVLPILVVIVFSFLITHFSFYISNEIIKLIL